jgi:EAL domain-containing protein (putative c-di-GMP-specific phosphodiesterase class I)
VSDGGTDGDESSDPDGTSSGITLSSLATEQILRGLQLARQHLEMDLAFVVEFVAGREVYRLLDGDSESFGLNVDSSLPGDATYCMKMVTGELPYAIPATATDPRVSRLRITADHHVGSYIAVPITLPNGDVFGSFGCLGHGPHPLDDRDVRLIALIGEMIGDVVQQLRERQEEGHRIADVIASRSLNLVLQPIFSLKDGKCLGVEALSRFPAGLGNPEQVFAAAHSAGLGLALERLALNTALAVLPVLTPGQYLSVNLTPSVAYELADQDRYFDFLPALVLEITEHAAVDSYAKLRERLRPRREQGLRLAIDDAGAGYASLKHVVELEPDMIKIDRSLVDGSANDRARRSAIRAFVILAEEIGAMVIAEGVEQVEDLQAITDLGVDAAQGYLLGRPTADRRKITRWAAGTALPSATADWMQETR